MRKPKATRPVHELRSAHYLRRSQAVGMPTLSVALSVACSAGRTDRAGRIREVSLRSWSACTFGTADTDWRIQPSASGIDADSFWAYMRQLMSKGGCVWVWQIGAAAGCTALELWKLAELGALRLNGYDPLTGRPENPSAKGAWKGQVVISDPPFSVMVRPSSGPGMMRMVCTRNLGLDNWEALCADMDVEAKDRKYVVATDSTGLMASSFRCALLKCWLEEWYETIRELDLGGLRQTAGSQAWHGWRHGYLSTPMLVHANDEAIKLERRALHAGRCEVLHMGRHDGPIYQLDISACYPAIATANNLPCRFRRMSAGDVRDMAAAQGNGWLTIADCAVSTDVPLAPYRVGDATLFPVGNFNASLCWPEVAMLIAHGADVKVKRFALYEPGKPFAKYMQALWRTRHDAESALMQGRRACIKRLMNSLIGKCAQWNWSWVNSPESLTTAPFRTWYDFDPSVTPRDKLDAIRAKMRGDSSDWDALPICRWRSIGWHVQYEQCLGETGESMPAVAAYIYSVGRTTLWTMMFIAGKDQVLYVDTDSLWVTAKGYRNMLEAKPLWHNGMGGLRLVTTHDWVEFLGYKYYRTPEGITCSGLSDQVVLLTDQGYEFWLPEKAQDALRLQREPQANLRGYVMPVERKYRHGIVTASGKVLPHHIQSEGLLDDRTEAT